MKNIDALKTKIKETKKESLTIIVKHDLVYQGDDDGMCDCGLYGPLENSVKYSECEFRTTRERNSLKKKLETLKKLLLILEFMDTNPRKIVMESYQYFK